MFRFAASRLLRSAPIVGSIGVVSGMLLLRKQEWTQSSMWSPKWNHTVQFLPKPFLAYCEEVKESTVDESSADAETEEKESGDDEAELIMVPDVSEGEEEEWIAEKEKCSFCKHFMLSPCREQFKKWSKCVDLAKTQERDFVKSCTHYTRALMNCTTEHSEYFSATRPDEGDDIEDDPNDSSTTQEAAKAE